MSEDKHKFEKKNPVYGNGVKWEDTNAAWQRHWDSKGEDHVIGNQRKKDMRAGPTSTSTSAGKDSKTNGE